MINKMVNYATIGLIIDILIRVGVGIFFLVMFFNKKLAEQHNSLPVFGKLFSHRIAYLIASAICFLWALFVII
ncbi:hypothetical protein CMO89_00340 [Candidatus Woesearchaeota archaeon]|nr:hypothetical protein [Candidatus Woesearchaeota archaeon]|tara:strand:+ start:617 stop:835 length:219 start_codon:yes stop_codon:yes gene_type:complete